MRGLCRAYINWLALPRELPMHPEEHSRGALIFCMQGDVAQTAEAGQPMSKSQMKKLKKRQ